MTDAFPTLSTARFRLRKIVQSDLAAVHQGLSDPRVVAHYGISYDSLAATQAQMDWFESLYRSGTGAWWAICGAQTPDTMIGACGINEHVIEHRRAELGLWLIPAHWRLGIMRECVAAVVDHAFDQMQLHRIEAEVEPENEASWRLLERLGFALEGVRRECELKNGRYLDLRCYAKLEQDGRH